MKEKISEEDKLCDEIHDLVKNKNPEILALRKQFNKETGVFVIECNYSAYADWLELKKLSTPQTEQGTCQCSAVDCEAYTNDPMCHHCRKPLRTETIHSRYSPPEPEGDLKQAIEDIKHFSSTHLDWAEHFEKNPDKEKEHLKTGEWSSATEHREIVEKYENVLNLLESLPHKLSQFKKEQDDPYNYFPQCDVKGCSDASGSCGSCWRETGYWRLCPDHAKLSRDGKPQPEMKQTAVSREEARGEDGCLRLRSEKITLLDAYSEFLCKGGYMDTDWNTEEPYAIDEFLKQEKDVAMCTSNSENNVKQTLQKHDKL